MVSNETLPVILELVKEKCNKDNSCEKIAEWLKTSSHTTSSHGETIHSADHVWQLRSAFMVMTMQSGFALLETGCVSSKNITNIMVKNIVDVAFGGICYWMLGYALSFGEPSTAVSGFGNFFLWDVTFDNMGSIYTQYFFQFSFASTSTTISSGAMAERVKLHGYMILSFVNTISYSIPAAWIWNKSGFLRRLGFFDAAGSFGVHGNGGMAALVGAVALGPRMHRFKSPEHYQMSSPVTALTGTLLLWWSWFAFNSGSTLGVDGTSGHLWKLNALISCNTLNGSIAGCVTGVCASLVFNRGRVEVSFLINAVLGGLVSITAACSVTSPLECLIIGSIGAIVAISGSHLVTWLKIDDPVDAIAVHLGAGFWGTIAVGLFGKDNELGTLGRDGLIHGGGFYLVAVQLLGCICIGAWSALTTYLFLFAIAKTIGLRLSEEDEKVGADVVEHGIVKSDGLRGLTHVSEGDTVQINSNLTEEQIILLKRVGVMLGALIAKPDTETITRQRALKWRTKTKLNLRKFTNSPRPNGSVRRAASRDPETMVSPCKESPAPKLIPKDDTEKKPDGTIHCLESNASPKHFETTIESMKEEIGLRPTSKKSWVETEVKNC